MTRRPPRSTRTDTLFPYTTLFRSPVLAAFSGAFSQAARNKPTAATARNLEPKELRRIFFIPPRVSSECRNLNNLNRRPCPALNFFSIRTGAPTQNRPCQTCRPFGPFCRTEDSRDGKECVRTFRSRGGPI